MADVNDQTMSLTSYRFISNFNNIENYFHWRNDIKTIDIMGSDGTITLHVTTYSKPCEIIQLIFTDNAFESINDVFDQIHPDVQLKINEMKKLFQKNSNLFSSSQEYFNPDYIDWSPNSETLLKKHREILEQIDLYRTYDNRHNLITKLLSEIIHYYLNEYLINNERILHKDIENIRQCFRQAIEEKNYLKYFIKAYTLTNNFYDILNKHLALYILDYFKSSTSSSTNYRLINCLIYIVTLIIHHPDRELYKYQGITYRGVRMKRKDLEKYQIGYSIMNRSFVSTSKYRSIAQIFAGNNSSNSNNNDEETYVSVLFKYTIKQKRTAINIEHLSTVEHEKEVLILPFAVFQVKDRQENDPQMLPPVLYEIDLEEYEDQIEINEQLNRRKKILTNIHYQNTRQKQYFWFKFLLIIFGLLFIFGIYYLTKINLPSSDNIPIFSKSDCPSIINRSVWKARKPKEITLLTTPVPYVAILHTTGTQCTTIDSCISKIQSFQKEHMSRDGWTDIGYNFLINTNGDIFQGRGWQYVGSHCYGFNSKSIGIALIGDFTSTQISQSLLDATKSLIDCGISYGYIKKDYQIVGHWGEGIPESYLHSWDISHENKKYCSFKN